MIRPVIRPDLAPSERYGLDLLLDLSRVARADGIEGSIVDLRIVDARAGEAARRPETAFTIRDGCVEVARDVLRWCTDVGGSAAEQRSDARDRYGRVPSSATTVVEMGVERVPVVSRCAVALRVAARRAAAARPFRALEPWPGGHRWAVGLSHDLDAVVAWPVFTALRLAELARKGELRRAGRALAAAMVAIGRNPLHRAALALLDVEHRAGVEGTWFVLAGTPTWPSRRAGDLTYDVRSRAARRIVDAVRTAGHEIGLHGSFDTVEQGELFIEQRSRLESVLGTRAHGVRQHYLRLRPGITHDAMARAGFLYDSTSGFADRNGFRNGVADVIPVWDERAQAASRLDEVPFTWMDRSLSKYRGIEDPDAWITDALELAEACRAVDGLWVGVWHPNLVPALGFPDAPAAYERLLTQLRARDPWVGRLTDAVSWRRRRRETRIVGLRPDGGVDAVTRMGGDRAPPLRLETSDGVVAESVREGP